MQRTCGAARVAMFSFLTMMAAQPAFMPAASARDVSGMVEPATVAMNPVPHHKHGDKLSLAEQTIDGKNYHVGRLVVNAPKHQVWNLLTDYDSAPSNFSYLKKCTRLNKQGKGEGSHLISFTAKTGVGPLTIDYVLEIKESESAGTIEWKRHSGAFKANQGYWKLEPVDNGSRTLITYAKHVEAGFPLPPALVNKAVKDSMPVIFKDLTSTLDKVATVRAPKTAAAQF